MVRSCCESLGPGALFSLFNDMSDVADRIHTHVARHTPRSELRGNRNLAYRMRQCAPPAARAPKVSAVRYMYAVCCSRL